PSAVRCLHRCILLLLVKWRALARRVGASAPYSTSSISLGRHDLSKKGGSGLYRRRSVNQPFSGSVWIQLPRATPSGCSGANQTVVEPSAPASAAGEG